MNGIKANERIKKAECRFSFVNLKLKILGQPYEEVLLTTDK